jgi:hypothetical protein
MNGKIKFIKGQCNEIFDLWFFSSMSPIWAPDARFEYGFEFAKLFDKVGASAVSMTPLRPGA